MPGLCECISTATRNRVNLNNNWCTNCDKPFRAIESAHNNSVNSDDNFYENTKEIDENSPIYINTFDGNQTFTNFDESKNNCDCANSQKNGTFCSNCGGLQILEDLDTVFPGISEDDSYLFGSVKRRPLTNLRRSNLCASLPNDDLYTQIPVIPFRPEENIEPLELQNFAGNFQLNVPDDLDIFINRQLEIVREIEPNIPGDIEAELNRQIEPDLDRLDVAIEPIINLDNLEIEHLYDDVENINMEMLRLQNIRGPRFEAKKSNVRTFFRKFEHYRDGHNPVWNNQVTLNMSTNLMDDDSLDYYDSLPEETQGNYENLRDNMIEHYDTGSPLSTQWRQIWKREETQPIQVHERKDSLWLMADDDFIPICPYQSKCCILDKSIRDFVDWTH